MKRRLVLFLVAIASHVIAGCVTHAKPEPSSIALESEHVVVRGESLWDISKKSGVSLSRLIELNPRLKNLKPLEVGERIRIRE